MAYFIIFCFSGLFFSVPRYIRNEHITRISYFIALMLPIVLSAVRGLDVGKDVLTYAYPAYKYAANVRNFNDLLGYLGMEHI